MCWLAAATLAHEGHCIGPVLGQGRLHALQGLLALKGRVHFSVHRGFGLRGGGFAKERCLCLGQVAGARQRTAKDLVKVLMNGGVVIHDQNAPIARRLEVRRAVEIRGGRSPLKH